MEIDPEKKQWFLRTTELNRLRSDHKFINISLAILIVFVCLFLILQLFFG